jgi:hypothetical protein
MRLGDLEIGQQEGGWLGRHRSAAIGVQRQLARWDVMLNKGIIKRALKRTVFSASATHQPTTRRLKMSRMTYR